MHRVYYANVVMGDIPTIFFDKGDIPTVNQEQNSANENHVFVDASGEILLDSNLHPLYLQTVCNTPKFLY